MYTIYKNTRRGLTPVCSGESYELIDSMLKAGKWKFNYEDESGYWYTRSGQHTSWDELLVSTKAHK